MWSEIVQKKKRVTIKDVAQLAGTSVATVSYVLNKVEGRYITPEMRTNVENAAAELGYVKSLAASRLKGKEMGVIAFLTPQFDNHFFLEVFFAIEEIANQKGYVLSVCNTCDDPLYEKRVIERLNQLWIDACLIIPTYKGVENAQYLQQHGIPFVSIERPLPGLMEYDFISSDNFDAAYQMTKHMIEQGHNRIALVYWDSLILNLDERLAGYRKALEDHGIAYEENLVYRTKLSERTEILTHAEGRRLTEEILLDPSVTAIFYSQYVLAEGGVRLLREKGRRIPEEISVGILGAPKWVSMSENNFTHILQPGKEIGKKAAEIIFSKLEKQAVEPIQETIACTLNLGSTVKKIG